ncbi:hypothetical protein QWZ13_11060 [Reinekea marina]|uniref:hypothetical protein n=1 Tax=Reinekea marina TaxID=1310421 RepID=UPI0025B54C65|nr:hypothetical protein [Reinekea marina]MDN3649452.1 hypothetical protein [Reinekea marina]
MEFFNEVWVSIDVPYIVFIAYNVTIYVIFVYSNDVRHSKNISFKLAFFRFKT